MADKTHRFLHDANITGQSPMTRARFEETIAWSVGCVLFTIIMLIFATVQYIRKVRASPKSKRKRKLLAERRKQAIEETLIRNFCQDSIPVDDFVKEVQRRKRKGLLDIEFKAVSRVFVQTPCEVALLPANKKRNHQSDVLPSEHCRVILRSTLDKPYAGYINASYIDSYSKTKAYIATQGPNHLTVNDFWQMIWQENISCIVMATNLFEHARQQCEKYWHNQHGRYGSIEVWLEATDIVADFYIRTFRVKQDDAEESRIVKQFQFASWSDHHCPDISSLLEYRRRIRAYVDGHASPVLVHCGAGGGRTGAYIALDVTLERLHAERCVDIYSCVAQLRSCRQHMVRNLLQYELLYDSIVMYLMCGDTVMVTKDLPAATQKLASRDPHTRLNGFERELQTLHQVVQKPSVGECAAGHRAENRRKSRDFMLQPPERARPYLITHASDLHTTDYINAVYIDGYRQTNSFVVTQWPQKNTINDIWRLFYDYNIPTVVLLNDMPFTRNYPCFWPTKLGEEIQYGPLTVKLSKEELTGAITVRDFCIRKPDLYQYEHLESCVLDAGNIATLVSLQRRGAAGSVGGSVSPSRTMRLFQLACWPERQRVPTAPAGLLRLLVAVDRWQYQHCHGRIPTCVISKNGVTRCGCFCALSIIIDKLKVESEVDVFRAVKVVKMNRPQLIENLMEYTYCYTFVDTFAALLAPATPLYQIAAADLDRADRDASAKRPPPPAGRSWNRGDAPPPPPPLPPPPPPPPPLPPCRSLSRPLVLHDRFRSPERSRSPTRVRFCEVGAARRPDPRSRRAFADGDAECSVSVL